MNRLRIAVLVLVVFASLSVAMFTPLKALPSLGQHRVLAGETLYCIGRGYGVAPWAIAQANGLAVLAHLSVGQVLAIPAVAWANVPPGPTCAPQFPPAGLGAAPATATSVVCTGSGGNYLVRRGDTLWRIARQYRTTVAALKQANHLRSNIIYVGQLLVIPVTQSVACPTPTASGPTGSTTDSSNPTTGDPGGGNPSQPTATSFVPPAPTNTSAPLPTDTQPPPTATDPNAPPATPSPTPSPTNTSVSPTNTSAAPTNTVVPPSSTPPSGYPPPVTDTPPPGYP